LHADEDGPVVEGGAVEEAGHEGAGEEGVVAVVVGEGAEEVAPGPEGLGTLYQVHLVRGVAVRDRVFGHGCVWVEEVVEVGGFVLLRSVKWECLSVSFGSAVGALVGCEVL